MIVEGITGTAEITGTIEIVETQETIETIETIGILITETVRIRVGIVETLVLGVMNQEVMARLPIKTAHHPPRRRTDDDIRHLVA